MTIEKVAKFRQLLAEQGTELTIEQAKELYSSALGLLKRSKKNITIRPLGYGE